MTAPDMRAPVVTPTGSPPERGVIALIRDLQSGSISGRSLGADDRRRCVEHLIAEGYSVVETAEILGVAERTIARDRAVIREANALQKGPEFAGEMAGHLLRQAESGVSRLRRIARERECPHATKVEAERTAWAITREMIQSLQRLGYLPEAAREVRASLHHQLGPLEAEPPTFDALLAEVNELESLCLTAHPTDSALLDRLGQARRAVAGFGAVHAIAAVAAQVRAADDPDRQLPPALSAKENEE